MLEKGFVRCGKAFAMDLLLVYDASISYHINWYVALDTSSHSFHIERLTVVRWPRHFRSVKKFVTLCRVFWLSEVHVPTSGPPVSMFAA